MFVCFMFSRLLFVGACPSSLLGCFCQCPNGNRFHGTNKKWERRENAAAKEEGRRGDKGKENKRATWSVSVSARLAVRIRIGSLVVLCVLCPFSLTVFCPVVARDAAHSCCCWAHCSFPFDNDANKEKRDQRREKEKTPPQPPHRTQHEHNNQQRRHTNNRDQPHTPNRTLLPSQHGEEV